MNKDFLSSVLTFLVKSSKGTAFLELLEEDFFNSSSESKIIFSLLKTYYTDYHIIGSKTALKEFLRQNNNRSRKQLPEELLNNIYDTIDFIFDASVTDNDFIRQNIIFYAQKQQFNNIVREYSKKIVDTNDIKAFKGLDRAVEKMLKLTETAEAEELLLLLRDFKPFVIEDKTFYPSKFNQLNSMMDNNGFSSPELITILSNAKNMKTILLMNITMHLVSIGMNLLYIDTENGKKKTERTAIKTITALETYKLYNPEYYNFIKFQVTGFKAMGGDLRIRELQAGRGNYNDIEREYLTLADSGFEADILIVDYLGNMDSIDTHKEKRIRIQRAYKDAGNFNNKYSKSTWTVGLLNRKAFDKEDPKLEDVGEDIEILANATTVLAWVRTPERKEQGTAKLKMFVNRNGIDNGEFELLCNPATAQIEEATESSFSYELDKPASVEQLTKQYF